MVGDQRRERRGHACDSDADKVRDEGGGGRAEGDHSEPDEAAKDCVPLVGERRQERRPEGRVPGGVHDVGDHQHGEEQPRLVVLLAQLPEGQGAQQAAWRHQAREVPNGPRPPDRHLVQGHEDRRQEDDDRDRHDHVEDGQLVLAPSVDREPRRVVVRGELRQAAEGHGGDQEQVHLVIPQLLHEVCVGQHAALVAARREGDQDDQDHEHDDVQVRERLAQGLEHPVVLQLRARREDPHERLPQALHEGDAPGAHLEAAVEVLVEVPDDEEQARAALHAAERQVAEDHPVCVEDVLGQGRHEHEEEDVHELRAGHEQVRRDAVRHAEPEDTADGGADVEGDVQDVVGRVLRRARALLHALEQRLTDRREDVAHGDDDMDPEADAAGEGLHQPLRDVVALREALLGQADAALQRLRVLLAALDRLHRLLHDLLRHFLTHGLRQELGAVVDVQDLHLLRDDGRRGHPAEGGLAAGRHGRPDGVVVLVVDPEVVQRERVAVSVPEIEDRLRVGLQQVHPPDVEGELRLGGGLGHLPVIGVRQVQGVVHGAEEGVEEHAARIRILLPEVNPGDLPQATHSAAHGGHPQQPELHVHVAEGL
mmetsp:Transcript_34094/g.90392  ORF Transcript_34094/g.90392 Transcript_34094/m.90392 type:complete len:596 (+) Transcript_34094:416-2203(+)